MRQMNYSCDIFHDFSISHDFYMYPLKIQLRLGYTRSNFFTDSRIDEKLGVRDVSYTQRPCAST